MPICPSIMARNMATLLVADIYPTGGPEIWSRNKTSFSLTSRISSSWTRIVVSWTLNPYLNPRSYFGS